MKFPLPAQVSTVPCRSCGALIAFVKTDAGRNMPVNASGAHRGESHFAHCNDPKRFRKRDRVKGPRA